MEIVDPENRPILLFLSVLLVSFIRRPTLVLCVQAAKPLYPFRDANDDGFGER